MALLDWEIEIIRENIKLSYNKILSVLKSNGSKKKSKFEIRKYILKNGLKTISNKQNKKKIIPKKEPIFFDNDLPGRDWLT